MFAACVCSAAEFDAAKHLNTHASLLGHSHNRLTLDKLKTAAIRGSADDESFAVSVPVMFNSYILLLLLHPFNGLFPGQPG